MKLPLSKLHAYQNRAIEHSLAHPRVALWLDMGLGKTVVTLCVIRRLLDILRVYGALIVAPLRVCQAVWRQEAAKWEYTSDLSFKMLTGPPKERARALRTRVMCYLINYENIPWLVQELEAGWLSRGKKPPFNLVVLDEISRLKSTRVQQGSVRGKYLRKILPFLPYRLGLTGTPASNGLQDIFGQFLVLDDGQRLGTSFSNFQSRYFYPVDYNRHRWRPFSHTEDRIRDLIGDITISMANEDYLDLPPVNFNYIWVDLPDKARKKYEEMEAKFFLELDSGAQVDINSEASLVNRCLQVAAGACYLQPGEKEWERIHDAKMDVLEEIVEEAAGQPILLSYQFQHDAQRIQKKFKYARWLSAELNEREMLKLQDDWNLGIVPLMMGHPGSMGHGLNLQAGSNILVLFGQNWSRDLVSQTIARLRRQGQTKPLIVHIILARDTVDYVQMKALQYKKATEESLRDAIKEYREHKKKRL